MRAVDPAVTMPYWDFTIEGEAIVQAGGKPSYFMEVGTRRRLNYLLHEHPFHLPNNHSKITLAHTILHFFSLSLSYMTIINV